MQFDFFIDILSLYTVLQQHQLKELNKLDRYHKKLRDKPEQQKIIFTSILEYQSSPFDRVRKKVERFRACHGARVSNQLRRLC